VWEDDCSHVPTFNRMWKVDMGRSWFISRDWYPSKVRGWERNASLFGLSNSCSFSTTCSICPIPPRSGPTNQPRKTEPKNRFLQQRCSAVSPWLSTSTVPQGLLGIAPFHRREIPQSTNQRNNLCEITSLFTTQTHLNATIPFLS
jgi:hypothetical protein